MNNDEFHIFFARFDINILLSYAEPYTKIENEQIFFVGN